MTVDPDAQTTPFAAQPPPGGPPGPPAPPVVADPADTGSKARALIVPCLVGGAVAVALGVYGRLHTPTGVAVNIAGFSSFIAVKSWLATVATVLAVLQVLSALAMYGKLPVPRGVAGASWVSPLHRWSGRLAFLAAVPVALHCLYALGAQSFDGRVLVHSILGCFFFGAFTCKMLLLRARRLPGWALPVFGGLVFSALAGLWLTSALWFFAAFGLST
jgi:hypothetical protein